MTSPFTIGNFNGWKIDGLRYSTFYASINTEDPDIIEAAPVDKDLSLTTPALTGGFTAGDTISITWSAISGEGALLTMVCLDGVGGILSTVTSPPAVESTEATVTSPIAAGTARVRFAVEFMTHTKWSKLEISAISVPGLEDATPNGAILLPTANGLPAGWLIDLMTDGGTFGFSHDTDTDSGDGNGSIRATSTTGGVGIMRTDTLTPHTGGVFSLKMRRSEESSLGGYYEAYDANDVGVSYGQMRYVRHDGWSTYGVEIHPSAKYLKIYVDGSPGVAHLDAIYLPILVAEASQNAAALTGARVTVRAYGGAQVSLRNPATTISAASGGHARLSAPKPSLSVLGHDSTGEQAAYLTAPSPTLAVATGANAKSIRPRAPQLSTTGTVTTLAAASLVAPSAILASGGTVAAMAAAALSPPSPNLIGYGGAVVSVALAGGPTLQVTGTTGGVAGVTVAAPLFQLSSSAAQQNHGSVDILAPSPRMGGTLQAWLVAPMATLTAIGSAVITATYEAYAINLLQPLDSNPSNNYEAKVPQATHYTNFPFTHVVRYQNSYYGANSTGLYLLEGTTDDGAPIPWAFETAMTDFKTPNKKTLAAAYFSGRFGPASTISLKVGETAPISHSFSTPRGQLAQNHRQVFGKGNKARYYALAASGTSTLELDGIECEVHQLTRRI